MCPWRLLSNNCHLLQPLPACRAHLLAQRASPLAAALAVLLLAVAGGVSAITELDVLQFALNLEYLEVGAVPWLVDGPVLAVSRTVTLYCLTRAPTSTGTVASLLGEMVVHDSRKALS